MEAWLWIRERAKSASIGKDGDLVTISGDDKGKEARFMETPQNKALADTNRHDELRVRKYGVLQASPGKRKIKEAVFEICTYVLLGEREVVDLCV